MRQELGKHSTGAGLVSLTMIRKWGVCAMPVITVSRDDIREEKKISQSTQWANIRRLSERHRQGERVMLGGWDRAQNLHTTGQLVQMPLWENISTEKHSVSRRENMSKPASPSGLHEYQLDM